MHIIGIDIAKRNHQAVIVDSSGKVVSNAFPFQNSCSGYNKLLDRVRKHSAHRDQLVFGMEATGHYWLALYTRLKREGYLVHVINPIQPNALRNLYLRQNKSDKHDAFLVAEVIRFGQFSQTTVPQETCHALRELCRNRFFLVDIASDLKRKVTALIDQVFPEYDNLFSSNFTETSLALLHRYPTPEVMLRARMDTLTDLLYRTSNKRFGKGKAMEVKELAKNTFGVPDPHGVYAHLIRAYISQLRSLQQEISLLDEQIAALSEQFGSCITSIPGIGPVLGAVILSEIVDISRFKSADKLAAFAGIDPTVRRSGDFIAARNHMSKRGSPYLRRAIWPASTVAVQHDPMFKAYYEKKAAEGMRYMNIIGHVTKKMASVIFAVLRDGRPYTPHLPQISA